MLSGRKRLLERVRKDGASCAGTPALCPFFVQDFPYFRANSQEVNGLPRKWSPCSGIPCLSMTSA